jgi:O-methyltransferase
MISFGKAYEEIRNGCLLGRPKSLVLYENLLKIPDEGDLAEIGVYRGSSSLLMRLMYPDRILRCYDTYCGILGAKDNIDFHQNGEFNCSLEEVQRVVGVNDKTFYHVGMFPNSFNEYDRKFAFVHCDTDTYMGTKSSLKVMIPLLEPGGVMIIDDYLWLDCPGVMRAIDEWNTDNHRLKFVGKGVGNQYVIHTKP